MLRREILSRGPWHALAVALALAAPAAAGSIDSTATFQPIGPNSTGDVEVDFPAGHPNVTVLTNPRYPSVNPEAYIAQHNLSPGWSIKDIRLDYNKSSDEMYVGVNTFGIAGDADGNGDPGTVSAAAAAQHALDVPHLGGRESITLGFDFNHDGRPDILAGVPGDKTQAGPGQDGFTVAPYKNTGLGIANSYGAPLLDNIAGLKFDPSAQHPDFEFIIRNFSKLPGYDASSPFGLIAFAGTPDDIYEEEGALFPQVSGQEVPEPASLLGWGALAAAGLAWRLRRPRAHA
jgi:hypothetical protein